MSPELSLPPLFRAIDRGEIACVQTLLPSIPLAHLNLELPTRSEYQPALLRAVARGDLLLTQTLVAAGARVDVRGPGGRTPLMQAYDSGHAGLADWLLRQGADPLAVNERGTRVFDFALGCASADALQTYLTLGLSLDHRNQNGRSPLHFAARNSDLQVLDWLLAAGLAADEVDSNGLRPLELASTAVVWRRLRAAAPSAAANIRLKDSDYSIHKHALRGAREIVVNLLDEGIDVQLSGRQRNSLLHYAAVSGQAELMHELISRGARIESQNQGKWRPLHQAADHGKLAAARTLLDAGARLDVRGNSSFIIRETPTALFLAASGGHRDLVELLLRRGADPDLPCDSSHNTALAQASFKGHTEVVRVLLAGGANPNGRLDEHGQAAFFYFPLARAANVEIVELLIGAGADIEDCNCYRERALHWLAEAPDQDLERVDALEALLQHGADTQVVDAAGRSPQTRAGGAAATRLLQRYAQSGRGQAATRTTGRQLLDAARNCENRCRHAVFRELLAHADTAAARYCSPDPYDDRISVLHCVLEALDSADDANANVPRAEFLTVIAALLALGADPNAVETLRGDTPLHTLARAALRAWPADQMLMAEIATQLLTAGADPDIETEDGCRGLDLALGKPLIETLRAHGAGYGAHHEAWFHAIEHGDEAIWDALQALATPLELRSVHGDTPWLFAARYNRPAALHWLAARAVDHAATGASGQTAWHLAAAHAAHDSLRALAGLWPEGLDVADAQGCTALMHVLDQLPRAGDKAAREAIRASAAALVGQGARIDIGDASGRTALDRCGSKALRRALEKSVRA